MPMPTVELSRATASKAALRASGMGRARAAATWSKPWSCFTIVGTGNARQHKAGSSASTADTADTEKGNQDTGGKPSAPSMPRNTPAHCVAISAADANPPSGSG